MPYRGGDWKDRHIGHVNVVWLAKLRPFGTAGQVGTANAAPRRSFSS